jgi:hypothetical protein
MELTKAQKCKAWRDKNPQKVKDYKRKYKEEHPFDWSKITEEQKEKLRLNTIEWRKKNPEKVKLLAREQYRKDRPARIQATRDYRESHPDYVKRCREKRNVLHALNKEKESEQRKKWLEENPEYSKKTSRAWREKNKDKYILKINEWKEKNPEKYFAHRVAHRLRKSGKIIPPQSCPSCGSVKYRIEGHHMDYSRPEDITWLCQSCHQILHKRKP